jgi:hypothetical protein
MFAISQLGMASALETLCGQAYGAKQYHMLGVYLQRSWLILLAFAVLLAPTFIFSAQLLIALGQTAELRLQVGRVAAARPASAPVARTHAGSCGSPHAAASLLRVLRQPASPAACPCEP